jgi:hypothetical protein
MGFRAILWAIAYPDELIQDRAIWGDRGGLFGVDLDVGRAAMLLGLVRVATR